MAEDEPTNQSKEATAAARVPALIAVLALTATGLLVHHCHQPPSVVSAGAPPELFSAERAYQRLENLLGDESPHPLGTPANEAVRTRLVTQLAELGLQPEVNSHWVSRTGPASASLVLAHNVLAELPSSHPELPAIMLACHHDSVPAGPGAGDDGAAMAAMLEVARILQAEAPLPRPVLLLFTDGEELGLFGAKGFALDNPIADRVGMILNFEARGSSGGSLLFETSRNNRWIIKQAARGLSRPISSSAYVEIYRLMPNSSDLSVFMRHDLQGMNFAFIGNPKHYHTPLDNLAHLDQRSLQHHGDNALEMVRQLLTADWEGADQARDDAVHTDLFGRWIVSWPASWGPWIAGILLAAIAVGLRIQAERHQWRTSQIGRATTCWFLVIGVGALSGWLGARLLQLAGATSSWFPAEMYFDVAVHGLCGAVGAVLTLALLRPVGPLFLLIHGLALALGAIILACTLTGFSYLFLLPAAVAATAILALLKFPAPGPPFAAACLVLGLATTTIGYPYLERLPEALGVIVAAPVVAALVAWLILSIAPLLCDLGRPLLLRTSLALAILTAAFFFLAVQTPPFTDEAPQQITLTFLEQAGREQAQLSVLSWEAPIPPALLEAHPALETPNPLFTIPGQLVSVAPAGLAAPTVELLTWTTDQAGDTHTARLRLAPSLPAQQILAGIPASQNLESLTAQERELDIPPGQSDDRKWLRFRGIPEAGIEVSLTWRGPARLPLVLVGITPGLPPNLATTAQLRDSLHACTAHLGDESIVVQELVLTPPPQRASGRSGRDAGQSLATPRSPARQRVGHQPQGRQSGLLRVERPTPGQGSRSPEGDLRRRPAKIAGGAGGIRGRFNQEPPMTIRLSVTRLALRLAMLHNPVRLASDAELVVSGSGALQRFRRKCPGTTRAHLIADTRRWTMRELRGM